MLDQVRHDNLGITLKNPPAALGGVPLLLIDVHKTLFRIARPNQDHFIMFPKKSRGFGVDIQFILSANSYHAAARLTPDMTFSKRFACKGWVHRRAEDVQSFCKHQ